MALKLIALAVFAQLGAAHADEGTGLYPLAAGVKVDLGSGWNASSMVNPAMNMPELRKLLSDARELRFRKGETAILVSTQTWKPRKGKSLDSYDIAAGARDGARLRYLQNAVEKEAVAEARTNGSVQVALVTLRARDGQQFAVRAGFPGGCVSTGNMRKDWTVIIVSIASDSCESQSHQQAKAAFLSARE